MAEDKTKRHRLSDLEVERIGLVSRGAVGVFGEGKNVFLTKAKETTMPDETNLDIELVDEDGEETPPEGRDEKVPGWGRKLTETVGKIASALTKSDEDEDVSKPDPTKLQAAANLLRQGGYGNVTGDKLLSMLDGGGDKEKSKETTKSDPDPPDVAKAGYEALKATNEAYLNQLRKEQAAHLEAVKAEFEVRYQKDLEAKETRIAELEKGVETAQDEASRREWIEKAGALRTIPVSQTEMGTKFHKLAKVLPKEEAEWWETTIKAMDAQAGYAALLGEFGTALSPEEADLVEKIEKADNPAEALLALPAHEQMRYLHDSRKRTTRGGS